MSAFPSLPLFTDAFIADTGHLSAQETGAYMMLLMMAWRLPGCVLPDDDIKLARWARVEPRTWARLKPTIMEFWTRVETGWKQKRLAKEHDHVSKRAEVARLNGSHGGRPKTLNGHDVDNPAGSSWGTQTKAPNPNPTSSIVLELRSKTRPKRVRTLYSEGFEAFWKAYPTDANMSKKEAAVAWQRLSLDQQDEAMTSLPAFRAYCQSHPDYRPIHACRYLSKERFEGHAKLGRELASRCFIERGTPDWYAWQEHLKAKQGKGSPVTQRNVGGRMIEGWEFPSSRPSRSTPLPRQERAGT
jgi:uncharacterized protein YdaU (DUF1376 family)